MGSFYYEIAVQSVEIVLATSQMTGGVMLLGELRNRLNKSRKKSLKNSEISWCAISMEQTLVEIVAIVML